VVFSQNTDQPSNKIFHVSTQQVKGETVDGKRMRSSEIGIMANHNLLSRFPVNGVTLCEKCFSKWSRAASAAKRRAPTITGCHQQAPPTSAAHAPVALC
jgi:hypothetical protein